MGRLVLLVAGRRENSKSQNSLACTQNPLFVTSHGGLDMIFRDPTCPYVAVVVAVVVCVDVYY